MLAGFLALSLFVVSLSGASNINGHPTEVSIGGRRLVSRQDTSAGSAPLFGPDGPKESDLAQKTNSSDGDDGWFPCALMAMVSRAPDLIKAPFVDPPEGPTENVKIKLSSFVTYDWKETTVSTQHVAEGNIDGQDNRLSTGDNCFVCCYLVDTDRLAGRWPDALRTAFLDIEGQSGYAYIGTGIKKGGWPKDVFPSLTNDNDRSHKASFSQIPDPLGFLRKLNDAKTVPFTVSFQKDLKTQEEVFWPRYYVLSDIRPAKDDSSKSELLLHDQYDTKPTPFAWEDIKDVNGEVDWFGDIAVPK
ncbi:hypothetical protein IAU59_004513 [Kwoniella sp. CBS 9459]